MAVITPEEQQQLQQIAAHNTAILESTQWQPIQLANSLSASNSPSYALGTLFRFNLANTSAYIRSITIWLRNVTITNSNTTTAGALNRNGFYQLLGSLVVRLGNHIYRVPAGAIPLLWQTYSKRGDLASFRGNQTSNYAYATNLFSAGSSIAASGSTAYTGYIEIPFAVLEMDKDGDGMAPTLANTGMEVEFTTPASGSLQGTDPFVSPFGSVGTLALSGTTPGTISVWASIARQLSVTGNGALPPFIVGSAFVYEDVPQPFSQGPTFYTFQGQESALTLVKSIVVIDNPGELANEYSDPSNLAQMDLMYDQSSAVYENGDAQNPYWNAGGTGGLLNWMLNQGKAIGDQPPGVYVFDFGRGTDADYPNSAAYFNLDQFTKAGLRIKYATAPATGATIHFLNQYLVPGFYKALSSKAG